MKKAKTVTTKSVKKTLKKLKKKTYYIQVRAYVVKSGNVKVTGNWSKIKKVKNKKIVNNRKIKLGRIEFWSNNVRPFF